MQKLNCPSCGGHLEIPESLEIAHCKYCGTKSFLQEREASREMIHIEMYKELSKKAFTAENYNEAIRYCDKVLEIDPKDVDSWIIKAVATSRVYPDNPGYDEAMKYLNRAADLSPNDEIIKKSKQKLTHKQVEFLHNRGLDKFYIGAEGYMSARESVHYDEREAQRYNEHHFEDAMDWYLKGLELSPGNSKILRDIKRLILEAHWIEWSDSVLSKAQLKEEIDTIKRISKQIQKLNKELDELESKEGLFFGRDKRDSRRISIYVERRELERKATENN